MVQGRGRRAERLRLGQPLSSAPTLALGMGASKSPYVWGIMPSSPISLSDLRRTFADPPDEARPMMRWWWFGPDATRSDIDRDLIAMADAGIGGVEVAFEYPLSPAPRRFLSAEFLTDLTYAARRAEELGLRFDLTLGSGWSFGGPHINPEHAARKLHWEHREIGAGAFVAPRDSTWPHDEFVTAYVGPGSLQELPDSYAPVPLTEDRLHVPAGVGPRVLLTATSRLTGQNVKRAAHGAEGPVHDHYSAAATRCHLDAVARPMVEAVGADRIGSVFCDSLEVYAADWTPGMLDIFAKRRGYRPEPRLWLLITEHAEAAQFRADFYRTLSELYEENFLLPLADWAHGQGLLVRVQSYGEPPAALSSYRHVDLVEGEQWSWTALPMTKWASSAASHLGLAVVSSETWTWVHAPSFRATPLDLKAEAHEHALLGINQFIGHGWPCRSSGTTGGLGAFFYASGALDHRNAWWPAMPSLMRYLQRLSWALRQGSPVRDVLLYLPTQDAYAAFGPSIDLCRVSTGLIPAEVPRALREGGYDFDLIDDFFLGELVPDESTVVVLPGEVSFPASTRHRLDAIRAAGGHVIVVAIAADSREGESAAGGPPVGHSGSGDPGVSGATTVRFLSGLAAVRRPDVELTPMTPDVGAVHRRMGDIDLWFIANTGPQTRTVNVAMRKKCPILERWDARSGATSAYEVDPAGFELTLHPYDAVLVVGHSAIAAVAAAREPGSAGEDIVPGAVGSPGARVALTQWRLHSDAGDDLGAVSLPHRWEDDPRIGSAFSGTLSYCATVDDPPSGDHIVLDFGPGTPDDLRVRTSGIEGRSYRAEIAPPVREVVEVLIDRQVIGVVWDAPWQIDLGGALRAGSTLTLRVSNTTANALAADTTVAEWAAQAERLHGRRFRMQALDRVLDGVSSGLASVPVLMSAPRASLSVAPGSDRPSPVRRDG